MKVLGALVLGCLAFAALMLFLGALPKLIAMLSDPPRIKRITEFFEAAGCTEIEVKPWPNHYGVKCIKGGVRRYAKCRVNIKSGTIEWIGGAPSWATPPNSSYEVTPDGAPQLNR
jgi:hypothetical protein